MTQRAHVGPVVGAGRAVQARILIVDDNEAKRAALSAALSPLGHRIVEAGSGVEALRRLMADDFAVILLDVQMPGMNGFETAGLVRQRQRSEMTPIVFITSFSKDEIDQPDHYAGGAVDFIFAPIPSSELRAKVSFFADLFLKNERLAAHSLSVQASVDQLRMLTDSAPIGIFQTDQDGCYVYTNPRWSEITHLSAQEARGRRWDVIAGPGPRGALAVPTGAASVSHRFDLVGSGRSRRVVAVTLTPEPAADGGPAGLVGTLADVTVETLAEAAAHAAEVLQIKVAASASHELRTPTAAIITSLEEILESAAPGGDDRLLLEIAHRNAQRLGKLIDDLVVLDQNESGALPIRLEQCDLSAVVAGVVASLGSQARSAGVDVFVHQPSRAPLLRVDPVRFEQALLNLVGNAVKFTPRGGRVDITISTGEGAVRFAVTDTGHGIAAGDLDKIFNRFYRTRSAVDNAIKGSGLGLSIARGMIEAQGGSIEVRSVPDEGSTFTLVLPDDSFTTDTAPTHLAPGAEGSSA